MPIQYFPKKITFDNYVKLFTNLGVLEKTFNTLVISFAALLGTIIFGSLAAYGFARFKTRGLNIAKAALLFSALLPGIVTARPLYDFLKSMLPAGYPTRSQPIVYECAIALFGFNLNQLCGKYSLND